jgi:hypothetical protein
MEKDNQWIVKHFSELVGKYPGRYSSAVNGQLVAVGDSTAEVKERARGVESEKVRCVPSGNSKR